MKAKKENKIKVDPNSAEAKLLCETDDSDIIIWNERSIDFRNNFININNNKTCEYRKKT